MSLGELYEAALLLLYGPRMPGWSRLVGHAIREIANRLPGVLGGPAKTGQLQYKNRMDDIAAGWRKAGLPLSAGVAVDAGAVGDSAISTTAPASDVLVPHAVYMKLQRLVEDHLATREKPAAAAARLFATFAASHDSTSTVAPVIGEWVAVTKWFQERAHDGGVPDDGFDRAEFCARFEQAERMLMALVRDFFKTTDALDEILEDTNT